VTFVSIIMPMRNEEAHIARCLDSVLVNLRQRDDVEVLCVDGASTDRSAEIVRDYARRDARIRLIDNPGRTVPVGLNRAIAQARGDAIIRLDCHAEYAPDYIARCEAVLRRTRADAVGGFMTARPERDCAVGRAIAAATSTVWGVGNATFRVGGGEREVDTVPFGCFRRDVFRRVGLYDERLTRNQDIELNSRIRRSGGQIVISPEIKLTYFCRATLSGLRAQAFHNGAWNLVTLYLIGGGLGARHLVPVAFVSTLLLLSGVGFVWRPAWLILAGTVSVYLLVGAIVAVRAAAAARAPAWLILLALTQLHLAYGVGSLWGLVSTLFKRDLRRSRTSCPPPSLAT